MIESLHITHADWGGAGLVFWLSDGRIFTVDKMSIIKLCLKLKDLDFDACVLESLYITQFTYNKERFTFSGRFLATGVMSFNEKIRHSDFLDFVLHNGKPLEMQRTIKIETECFSAEISIQKLRELINRGDVFYVPDSECSVPKDTLIVRKASKILKPLLNEFGA